MLPKEGIQYPGIVQLLTLLRWTLIGLFASDTDEGENFMRTLTPMLVRNGICVVISQFSATGHTEPLRDAISKWRQVNVFVHFMEYDFSFDKILPFHLIFISLPGPIEGKVWIISPLIKLIIRRHWLFQYIHSIWNFDFRNKDKANNDVFEPILFVQRQFQDQSFHCSFSKQLFSDKGRKRCTQKIPLDSPKKWNSIQILNDHHVYSVIKTLAHSLDVAYSSRSRRRRKKCKECFGVPRLQSWQVWGPDKDTSNLVSLVGIQRTRVPTSL
uniref:Receptor ligand binding region domain-containing protein n=1 Tax=Micrurus lemniscatus lemniscatus TaxID=129467 RepID=A0A2D4IR10_MICLE